MIRMRPQHIESFRGMRRRRSVDRTEAFLREHFEERLAGVSRGEIEEALDIAKEEGRPFEIESEAELRIYLACACVAGLYLLRDRRQVLLFHEDLKADYGRYIDNYNVRTFAKNLDRMIERGAAWRDPLAEAKRALSEGAADLPEAASQERWLAELRQRTPARLELFGEEGCALFLEDSQAALGPLGLPPERTSQATLAAWYLGTGFWQDPLCQEAVALI